MASSLTKQVATANRRSRDRGLEGSLSTFDWRRACTFFEGRCAYCGTAVASTIDHFQPMARGGPTSHANAIPSCIFCNERKGASAPDQLPATLATPARVAHIRGYLEEIGRARQQLWRDLCAREPAFAAMDRKTTQLKTYCEQQALHHETQRVQYTFLRMMLFGVEWDPAYSYQVTVSLDWHRTTSTDPRLQTVCADLQCHLIQEDTSVLFSRRQ